MKKIRQHITPEGVQCFRFLYLRFDIDKAMRLVKNKPIQLYPSDPSWSALISVNPEYAMTTDLSRPVILAHVILEKEPLLLLIDGHHRNYKAVKTGVKEIPAQVLSVAETFKIMQCGVPEKFRAMVKQAERLGLLD